MTSLQPQYHKQSGLEITSMKLKGMLSYVQAAHSQEMENSGEGVGLVLSLEPEGRNGRCGRLSAQVSSLLGCY